MESINEERTQCRLSDYIYRSRPDIPENSVILSFRIMESCLF
jgi:hypothetical protein